MDSLADPKQAHILSGFFKTGKGQYGEGDLFLGIKVPIQRGLVSEYSHLPRKEILLLLKSPYHEHRLTALLIMVRQFERHKDEFFRKQIYKDYLAHARYINNWDLVDLSAPNIVGEYLLNKERKILYKMAKSELLWERRIAILATFTFIKKGETEDVFAIASLLMNDDQDLIHKATGWMLREAGKRVSEKKVKDFLEKHYRGMPRTMLRYAIERFNKQDKAHFMARE